ncbi:hypothetical protein PTW37_09250 [Arthrobacter agilis]|uniref:hypothetical protein n=1 Tax=Arthrobacter agilis TaxID=37921 RepID=UPI002365CF27|nr:hypothetical protein [Arthrobacter agilis]WDF32067.1 hypothetical protein PTW37_09250 [Arthrobacter agilis]
MRSSIRSLAIALTAAAVVVVAPLVVNAGTAPPPGGVASQDGAVLASVDDADAARADAAPAEASRGRTVPAAVRQARPETVRVPTVPVADAPSAAVPGPLDPAVEVEVENMAGMGSGGAAPVVVSGGLPPAVASQPKDSAVTAGPVVTSPQSPTATVGATAGPDRTGSGMGGDLPPEALPSPPYPKCPITAAGPWWTDPADPYTCLPPGSLPFYEPTPPGIDPGLLEPIFEEPGAPGGSLPFHEPTPPGIDPGLLEPIFEDPVLSERASAGDEDESLNLVDAGGQDQG